MAQQVVIAGALFNDVPSISVPDSNSVWHPFVDPSVTTAAASDVASGKLFIAADGTLTSGSATAPVLTTKSITANGTYNASSDSADGYSSVTVNVSGGASNVVIGTFTAGTAGTAQTVNIDYSGNGYPVSLSIYPSDGFTSTSSIGSATHQYAIICYFSMKRIHDSAPTYAGSGSYDHAYGAYLYKSSTGSGTSNTVTRINGSAIYNSADATTSAPYFVRITSKNSLSIFVSSTSYGFLSGATYKYVVVYSS